ncbi:hypothetical protein VB773_05565 [Haloarculaceae archaeon H-GB2-1]|nr:hypothetical protein [Haloarculaceae archaeon H-GB1-1]MEA5389037.1 hypothetical protein [Haloarculaceae archaeon H-GB11]MEA5407097.1 hypothetical protein [Haloarculaceae archaeon H-GB2-1]
MRATRSVALSLLLVFALLVAAVPAVRPVAADDSSPGTAHTVSPSQNTTSFLAIEASETERDQYGSTSIDVAGAVAVDTEKLHGRYNELSLRTGFIANDDSERRIELLRSEASRIERRTDALEERQRRALRQYNEGTISTHRFLRELARIDAAARALDTQLVTVRRDLEPAGTFSLPNRLRSRYDNLQADLVTLEGPVRRQLAASLATKESTRVLVLTSEDAIVLSQTTTNRYVREAYLGDEREPGGVDQFGASDRPRISVAYQRAAELYPWAFDVENALAPPSATGFGNTSVYRISVDHSQGDLTTYLDGSTQNAFREIQSKRLRSIPTSRVSNNTVPLTLRVNHTHATGPMQVTLIRNAGDEPIDGTVRVNGDRVGRTGSDGTLWTVTPNSYTVVNVTTAAGESVQVSFSPN